ncbi:hypothetical protein MASR1M101_41280 [Gemmatimonas sp.]
MIHVLDLSDGRPLIPCRDPWQALWLARLWLALAAPDRATWNAGMDVSPLHQPNVPPEPRPRE